jgi:hypothetical protein
MPDVLLRVKIEDEVHRDYLESQMTDAVFTEFGDVKLLRHAFKGSYLAILIRVKETEKQWEEQEK